MPPGREATRSEPRQLAESGSGAGLIVASMVGTAALTVTALIATIAPRTLDVPALAVALAMFFCGTVTLAWALVRAAGRSRTETVDIAGVFGVGGSMPQSVRNKLLGSLAVEAMVALATAAARPYTSLSFGILAPMWALGLVGAWGARHGAFPLRPPDPRRPGLRSPP